MEQSASVAVLPTNTSAPTFLNLGQLVVLDDASDVFQLRMIDLARGLSTSLFKDENRVVGHCAARTGALAWAVDRNGSEHFEILASKLGHSAPHAVTKAGGMAMLGTWSTDGRYLAYGFYPGGGAHSALMEFDSETGVSSQLARHEGIVHPLSYGQSGRYLLCRLFRGFLDMELLLADRSSGLIRRLSKTGLPERIIGACWLPHEPSLIVATDGGGEFVGLCKYDLISDRSSWLFRPEADVDALDLSPDGKTLAVAIVEKCASQLHTIDAVTGEKKPLKCRHRGTVTSLQWSPDGKQLAVAMDMPFVGARVLLWMRDLDSWSDTDPVQDPGEALIEPVQYVAADGLPLEGLLYRPADSCTGGERSAVVYAHGGPAMQYRYAHKAEIECLVTAGHTVLAPNIRGSTGYGRRFAGLDDKRLRVNAIGDFTSSAAWLSRHRGVPRHRMVSMGASYGGFVALAAIVAEPEQWAAGIDLYGITDFRRMLSSTAAWRRTERAGEYGDPELDMDFLESISPLKRIDRITVPMLVAHGTNDVRVPFSESRSLVTALQTKRQKVEFLEFADEGHVFFRRHNRLRLCRNLVSFVGQSLNQARSM